MVDKCEESWVFNPVRKTCLKVFPGPVSDANSRIICKDLGGYHAIIDSKEARDWIISAMPVHFSKYIFYAGVRC